MNDDKTPEPTENAAAPSLVSLPSVAEPTPPPTPPDSTPNAPLEPRPSEEVNIDLMRITLYKMKDQLDIMLHLLEGKSSSPTTTVPLIHREAPAPLSQGNAGALIEGYFNGEKMISDVGEVFDIPQNYASKSKLVEGDRMKLTITNTGSFLYKQIKPIERQRIRGELISGGTTGQWMISSPLAQFKVLTAAVTFHKGRIGDEVVLLIPASGHSEWGAIEHIIHKEF